MLVGDLVELVQLPFGGNDRAFFHYGFFLALGKDTFSLVCAAFGRNTVHSLQCWSILFN